MAGRPTKQDLDMTGFDGGEDGPDVCCGWSDQGKDGAIIYGFLAWLLDILSARLVDGLDRR
jgi:hypothetical protein